MVADPDAKALAGPSTKRPRPRPVSKPVVVSSDDDDDDEKRGSGRGGDGDEPASKKRRAKPVVEIPARRTKAAILAEISELRDQLVTARLLIERCEQIAGDLL